MKVADFAGERSYETIGGTSDAYRRRMVISPIKVPVPTRHSAARVVFRSVYVCTVELSLGYCGANVGGVFALRSLPDRDLHVLSGAENCMSGFSAADCEARLV